MGNLAYTTPDVEEREDQSMGEPGLQKAVAAPRLRLISRPVLVAEPVPNESLLQSVIGNVRETFFPEKQAPLLLTSRPVRVGDPMQFKRSKASTAVAALAHAVILGLIVWVTLLPHRPVVAAKPKVTPTLIMPYIPITKPTPKPMGGGGGGGEHKLVEPVKGKLPKVEKQPVAPPQLLVVDHPKLAAPAAVKMPQEVKIPENRQMPNLGMPQSQQIAVASQGSGAGSGFGMGAGGGIGAGSGAGVGMGNGGGYGGGVMSVGGGVSAPTLIHSVDPEFTDAARRAHHEGEVSIQLIVDSQGRPQNVHVVKQLGMGLDEKAVEAVRQYRFHPAMYQGHPVAVQMVIQVNFHLY